ncbi:carboxymuconolactone decarboxylase family protein [Salinactinospora qingdaonensis]|uniref:Carboxymuconolactone decarboxylase-like domain-containing protein n=1 Tax=Salinactinospora qingdaonensis TaxID=702744 RepID=A0ABP7GDC7_9ACTN
MARISLDPPRTLLLRLGEWYSRRRFGTVLDPGKAYAHNTRVLRSVLRFESGIDRWKKVDPALKHLAVMVSAMRIGCAWCVDFGYWEAEELGLPVEKIRRVANWREHRDAFTEVESLVMDYAEAMTTTPPTVTDELGAALRERLGEEALVELTTMIAVENLRSRVNSALGLTSQGFSDHCAVPAARAGQA